MDATKFIMLERACSDAFVALVSSLLATGGLVFIVFSCAAPKDTSEYKGSERIPIPYPFSFKETPVIKELALLELEALDRIDAM